MDFCSIIEQPLSLHVSDVCHISPRMTNEIRKQEVRTKVAHVLDLRDEVFEEAHQQSSRISLLE